jgi:hypothetical protein
MKFMMMMHAPRGDGEYQISSWKPEEFRAHIDFMMQYNKELIAAGEFVAAEGLAPPGPAKLVRGGPSGETITDGPFAESKEFLVGYWIVDVDSEQRVLDLAAKASMAPGPGGKPLHIPIEVRQVMSAPPTDL